jgi:GNAT superfamily N-acetyltransferase
MVACHQHLFGEPLREVPGLRIEYLKDNLRYASRLADLCARQWQHLYLEWERGIALREFKSQRNDGTLPISLFAIENEEFVGMVSLIFDDLLGHEHLNPWPASLLLLPEHRKKGVGAHLVREAERCLLFNRIPRAYLFTESAGAFFERLGWIVAESGTCNHYPIVVLKKELQSNDRQHRL